MPAGFESYNPGGKIQFSSLLPHPRLVSKTTAVTVDAGYGAQAVGSISVATFTYTADVPMPAFRSSAGSITVSLTTNFSGSWQTQVHVSAPVGTTVTMYLFDITEPVPGAPGTARMESYAPSGRLLFALSMQPARIVGRIAAGIFNGDPSRRYAVLMPTTYQQISVLDIDGSAPSQRYQITFAWAKASINDATGAVSCQGVAYRRFRQAANPGPSIYGSAQAIILDVTNY